MKENSAQPSRSGYAIFTETLLQGVVPACHEGDHPATFPTELEAQREIADHLLTRIRQFLDGERDFEGAIATDEFVLPVNISPDGSVAIKD